MHARALRTQKMPALPVHRQLRVGRAAPVLAAFARKRTNIECAIHGTSRSRAKRGSSPSLRAYPSTDLKSGLDSLRSLLIVSTTSGPKTGSILALPDFLKCVNLALKFKCWYAFLQKRPEPALPCRLGAADAQVLQACALCAGNAHARCFLASKSILNLF